MNFWQGSQVGHLCLSPQDDPAHESSNGHSPDGSSHAQLVPSLPGLVWQIGFRAIFVGLGQITVNVFVQDKVDLPLPILFVIV